MNTPTPPPSLPSPSTVGRVTLVGAGPGDPELLTLKALRAIEAATVALVDDLVSSDIVALVRPGTRVIHVGKRGGCKSTPQAFILRLMVAAALEGERVVRLKGGDPLIFGRAGEEIEHLRAHGISVDIVPGISAAQAAAASLGVSLTHRDHAHGMLWVTGHAKPGGEAMDWVSVGRAAHALAQTIGLYMGLTHLKAIASGLIAGGLPALTPAFIVQDASLVTQESEYTTLGALCESRPDRAAPGPAIVLIGPALSTSEKYANSIQWPGAWRELLTANQHL